MAIATISLAYDIRINGRVRHDASRAILRRRVRHGGAVTILLAQFTPIASAGPGRECRINVRTIVLTYKL